MQNVRDVLVLLHDNDKSLLAQERLAAAVALLAVWPAFLATAAPVHGEVTAVPLAAPPRAYLAATTLVDNIKVTNRTRNQK